MRVAVDRAVCQHHGQCTVVAPEVFGFDAADELRWADPVTGAAADAAEEAVSFCPVQAISVTEEAGGD